jgi:tRNA pseudouridine55 synthase
VTNNTELSGILPVKKQQGWTSFDVIGKLRGITHIKRLGHGGTLDPMAEGVLPVFVGKATKCCDILPDKRKRYKAGFRLGLSTDTEDITGKILTECENPVTLTQIEEILPLFSGDIMQLPPMYSAVKVGGKKLYQLAREGKTVERTLRKIHVYGIEITAYDEQKREGILEIDCGQGTYVRTVIADMGEKLGVGGVMTSLVRTLSNGITLDKCLTISEIEQISAENRLGEILLPTDKAFAIYPETRLGKWETSLYKNGVKLRPEQVCCADKSDESAIYRVYGFDGGFLGTGHFVGGEFRSHKNFF